VISRSLSVTSACPINRRHHERETIVGVISDTHGLMRPAAIEALRGCDLIIHAGDVRAPEVIDALRGAEAIGMAATPALSLREFRRVTPFPSALSGCCCCCSCTACDDSASAARSR
jgi:hypothetical protein